VIRIVVSDPPLSVGERYGLDVLVDLSRLIRLADDGPASTAGAPRQEAAENAVTVRITGSNSRGEPSFQPAGVVMSHIDRGFETRDDEVIVPRELLWAIVDVAGAAIEQRSAARDRYGRVPSVDNPLVAAGREREPVVSVAAAALRAAVARTAGRRPVLCIAPWPDGRRWCAAVSHDLDVVSAWPLFSAARIAELLGKRRTDQARRVLGAILRNGISDPVWRGVRDVLDADHGAGITATWFVLSGTPTMASFHRGDLTYRPESRRGRRIVGAVRGEGHEVGLHGSFATMDAAGVFETQRTRLGRLSGEPVVGVRQHFLRMRPGATQREMARSGFQYDATYGFPDRNGFRLGVADAVPGWDEEAGRESGLWEFPLTWMDRAQSKYQGIEDPSQWVDDALALAVISQRLEGAWTGLWHPNLTAPLGYPGAPAAYAHLVAEVMARQPFTASFERVIAWRRLRRAVQLVASAEGGLFVSGPPARDFDVSIEDGGGRPVIQLGRGGAGDQVRVPI
jgi:hypothetical protein